MAEPINLNRVRKAKAIAGAKAQSAANRVKFGRTAVEKAAERRETARQAAVIAGAKRDDPSG